MAAKAPKPPKTPKPPKSPKTQKTKFMSSRKRFWFESVQAADIEALLQRLKDEFLPTRQEGQDLVVSVRLGNVVSAKKPPPPKAKEAKLPPSFRILLPSHPGGRKQGFVLQAMHLPLDPAPKPPPLDPDVASQSAAERLVLYREFVSQIRALFAQIQAFAASAYTASPEEKERWLSQSVMDIGLLLRVASMGTWDWRRMGGIFTAPWLRFALKATFDALFEGSGTLPDLSPFSTTYVHFLRERDRQIGERRLEVLSRGAEENPYLAPEIEKARTSLKRDGRGRYENLLVSTLHLPVYLDSPRLVGRLRAACEESPSPFSCGAWKGVIESLSPAEWGALSAVPWNELDSASNEEDIHLDLTLSHFDPDRFFSYCNQEDPWVAGGVFFQSTVPQFLPGNREGGSRRLHPRAWTVLGWRVALTGLGRLREQVESQIPALEAEVKDAFLRSALPRLEQALF